MSQAPRQDSTQPLRSTLVATLPRSSTLATWLVVAGGTALALRTHRPWPIIVALGVTLLLALDKAPAEADVRTSCLSADVTQPQLPLSSRAR